MPSSTVENYVKQIYLEQRGDDALVSMGQLASAMEVAPGTATSMVKTLSASGLAIYEPREGTRLTPHGEVLALHVLRRHRLVELLLVEVLKLDWSEVHEEAELLEHVISDKVLGKIDALLGHPRVDPHGDPIPSASGRVKAAKLRGLDTCSPAEHIRIERVLDQDEDFLKFLNRKGLRIGVQVKIEEVDAQADVITVSLDNGECVSLGCGVGEKILVKSK